MLLVTLSGNLDRYTGSITGVILVKVTSPSPVQTTLI